LHEVDGRIGVGVGGREEGLVAITVEAVVNASVSGVGHVAAAVGGIGAVIARRAVLGIEVVTAWIVHEVALAGVDASGVEHVLVVAAAVVVVDVGDVVFAAAVAISGVGVGGARGACDADDACVAAGVAVVDGIGVEGVSAGVLHDVGALIVVVYWLAFDAVVGVLVDVAVNLRLL